MTRDDALIERIAEALSNCTIWEGAAAIGSDDSWALARAAYDVARPAIRDETLDEAIQKFRHKGPASDGPQVIYEHEVIEVLRSLRSDSKEDEDDPDQDYQQSQWEDSEQVRHQL